MRAIAISPIDHERARTDGCSDPPTYAWQTWVRLMSRRQGRWGMALIVMFTAAATVAPLLAGETALLEKRPDGWRIPIWRTLTRPYWPQTRGIDCLFNAALICSAPALVAVGAYRLFITSRRVLNRSRGRKRTRWRPWAVVWAALVLLLAGWLYFALKPFNPAPTQGRDHAIWRLYPPIPFDPVAPDPPAGLQSPNGTHWLGTTRMGTDVLSRLIHGARPSLIVGFCSMLLSMMIGVTLGALGGYFGRWVDATILRLIEIVICFPVLFLIMAIATEHRWRGILLMIFLIGISTWPGAARLVRAEFLRHKTMEYVLAARLQGAGSSRIIVRHILPNAIQPALVFAAFAVSTAILYEGALSFLGLGAGVEANWGTMLKEAREMTAPLLALWPGLAISLVLIAFNLVGSALRSALDPRSAGMEP